LESILDRKPEIFESGNQEPIFPEKNVGFSHVLKLTRFGPALAAALAVLAFIWEIPFFDSCVPD
jgi:uncharacterized membrane protein YfbV (UPF0208 family)